MTMLTERPVTEAAAEDPRLETPQTGRRSLETIQELTGDSGISIFRPNLQQLRQETLVVKLKVRYYRANQKLTLEDLGLNQASPEYKAAADQCQRLGSQTLLPSETLNEIRGNEVMARTTIKDRGFEHTWGGYLIPIKRWPLLRQELEERRARHLALADQMAENLPELKARQAERFRVMARTVLAIAKGYSPHEAEKAPVTDAEIDAYVERVMATVPDAQTLRDSFSWSWSVHYVDIPRVLEGGMNLDALEHEAALKRTQLENLDKTILQRNENIANDKERAVAQAELQDVLQRQRVAREVDEEIRRTHAAAVQEELQSQFRAVAAKVRTLLNTTVAGIADNIERKGGQVHGRQIEMLRSVAEKVAELNFHHDPEIDRLGALMKQLADTPPTERRDEAFVRRLQDIERVTRGELLELAREARGEMELPDLEPLALAEYRTARAVLAEVDLNLPAIERKQRTAEKEWAEEVQRAPEKLP